MPDDKKNTTKLNGFRGLFRRKESTSDVPKPANDTPSQPQEQNKAATAKRSYTPRYAARDHVLSIPVEDRPELVAKAKQTNLNRLCSDIGFTPGSSSRSSSHSRSSSGKMGAFPRHPSLQISRHASMDLVNASNMGRSLRASMMSRSSSTSDLPSQQAGNALELQHRGIPYKAHRSSLRRPRPRMSQSAADGIPQSIPETQVEHQVEDVDDAMDDIELEEHDDAENDASSEPSNSSSGYVSDPVSAPGYVPKPGRFAMPAPQTRQKIYFGHKTPLPDLRQKQDKGKQRAADWNGDEYTIPRLKLDQPSETSEEPMASNVISTTGLVRDSQTIPAHLPAPSQPQPSGENVLGNDNTALPDIRQESVSSQKSTVERSQELYTPSLTESESNGSSYYNNNNSSSISSFSTIPTVDGDVEDGKTEKGVKLNDEVMVVKDSNTDRVVGDKGPELEHVLAVGRAAKVYV